jgi:hypothetical protein
VSLAFWWHFNNCTRYIRLLRSENDENLKKRQIKFEGAMTYPCFCLPFKVCRRWPIESIVKIILPSIDFTAKIITGFEIRPKAHIDPLRSLHMPLQLGFMFAGWVEVLVHNKVPLPKRITQVMTVLQFSIEGFIMGFHTHPASLVETHIHRLLTLTIICSVIVAIGECFDPNNFSFIVTRSLFTLTQGTWLIQTGFILWPLTDDPYFTWERDSHDSVIYITMSYAYHLIINAFMLIIFYLVIHKFISRSIKFNFNQIEDDDRTLKKFFIVMTYKNLFFSFYNIEFFSIHCLPLIISHPKIDAI